MNSLEILNAEGKSIALVQSDTVVIRDAGDALELMAEAGSSGARAIVLQERHFQPAFFDLSTGLAGEILQKFSNYRVQMAVIGDFAKYESKSLRAFISESNRGNLIFFVPDRESAIARIAGGSGARQV